MACFFHEQMLHVSLCLLLAQFHNHNYCTCIVWVQILSLIVQFSQSWYHFELICNMSWRESLEYFQPQLKFSFSSACQSRADITVINCLLFNFVLYKFKANKRNTEHHWSRWRNYNSDKSSTHSKASSILPTQVPILLRNSITHMWAMWSGGSPTIPPRQWWWWWWLRTAFASDQSNLRETACYRGCSATRALINR